MLVGLKSGIFVLTNLTFIYEEYEERFISDRNKTTKSRGLKHMKQQVNESPLQFLKHKNKLQKHKI